MVERIHDINIFRAYFLRRRLIVEHLADSPGQAHKVGKAIFSIIELRSLDRVGLARTPRGDLPRQTYKVGESETVTVCPSLSPLICTTALKAPFSFCSMKRELSEKGLLKKIYISGGGRYS